MPRKTWTLHPLPAVARAELERCVEENLSARQTRLRLIRCGAAISERSVSRWILQCRAEHKHLRDLETIGRGLGSAQLGNAGAVEILRASLPEWREKQSAILRDLFAQFQKAPSADLFSGLVVGLYAILLGRTLADQLGAKNG